MQRLSIVSIPNGMEFYWMILIDIHDLCYVSIPNGMEFYSTCTFELFQKYAVSIPNGMEFYARVRYLSRLSARFNSQRDGILPSSVIYRGLKTVFQFPTGWNSTWC